MDRVDGTKKKLPQPDAMSDQERDYVSSHTFTLLHLLLADLLNSIVVFATIGPI